MLIKVVTQPLLTHSPHPSSLAPICHSMQSISRSNTRTVTCLLACTGANQITHKAVPPLHARVPLQEFLPFKHSYPFLWHFSSAHATDDFNGTVTYRIYVSMYAVTSKATPCLPTELSNEEFFLHHRDTVAEVLLALLCQESFV